MIEQLLPPSKRKAVTLAYMNVFGGSMQYQRDLLFDTYADGYNGSAWAAGTYTIGQRARYIDHYVYEVIVASTTAVPTDTTKWTRITNNWIGVRERARYTGTKMVLEYALNKWFETTFRNPKVDGYAAVADATHEQFSDIYISNNAILVNQFQVAISTLNQPSFIPKNPFYGVDGIPLIATALNPYAFTIFVPLAVFNALAATNTERENIIRAFADKYVIAGIGYNVTTY
jgi:hypothetical protein